MVLRALEQGAEALCSVVFLHGWRWVAAACVLSKAARQLLKGIHHERHDATTSPAAIITAGWNVGTMSDNGFLCPARATPPTVAREAGQAAAEEQQGTGTGLGDFDFLAAIVLTSMLVSVRFCVTHGRQGQHQRQHEHDCATIPKDRAAFAVHGSPPPLRPGAFLLTDPPPSPHVVRGSPIVSMQTGTCRPQGTSDGCGVLWSAACGRSILPSEVLPPF